MYCKLINYKMNFENGVSSITNLSAIKKQKINGYRRFQYR